MNILLTAATAKEIEPFLEYCRHTKQLQDIDILITGIGLTTATYHLSTQLHIKRPQLVIQAGIAGCFDRTLSLGSVVVVKKETIADQGVIERKKLKTLFDLALVPSDQYPFKKGWLENNSRILQRVRLRKVNAISINEITTSKQKIKFYTNSFQPVIESMEGAALHYTCLMEKIPFIQLRGVSNYIAERNKKKWDLETSVINLNKELIKLITAL